MLSKPKVFRDPVDIHQFMLSAQSDGTILLPQIQELGYLGDRDFVVKICRNHVHPERE